MPLRGRLLAPEPPGHVVVSFEDGRISALTPIPSIHAGLLVADATPSIETAYGVVPAFPDVPRMRAKVTVTR